MKKPIKFLVAVFLALGSMITFLPREGRSREVSSAPDDYRQGMASDIEKLSEIRNTEFAAAKKQAANSLEEYWAGSITASIMRDYRAGRVRQRKVER